MHVVYLMYSSLKFLPWKSFFPLYNFNKCRNYSQNFLTFSFNPFATLVYNFKAIPSSSLLNWTKTTPQKIVFLVKYL